MGECRRGIQSTLALFNAWKRIEPPALANPGLIADIGGSSTGCSAETASKIRIRRSGAQQMIAGSCVIRPSD